MLSLAKATAILKIKKGSSVAYLSLVQPHQARTLPDGCILATSVSGDHFFFSQEEYEAFLHTPKKLTLKRQAELRARFLLGEAEPSPSLRRLIASRIAAKRETVTVGPALHIIVPTLQCAHSCQYCQVSRSLDDQSYALSHSDIDAICKTIFESPSPTLTVEFQGGDPLLRFDLVEYAILQILKLNQEEERRIRFVIASTLHQLDERMCAFFKQHGVYLSTSIDGPPDLHNRNRPVPGRNAYERTLKGIALARHLIGQESVAALMTTTKASLKFPEAIVDEYVHLGFKEIFLRPLSSYGFAKRNQAILGYSVDDFLKFYRRGLQRVLHWNRQGIELREVYTSILLNKVLSTFDAGYVDLQSPTGAGSSVLVYNYDGYVYPSDEARMLVETGDTSLRMGRIGEPLDALMKSSIRSGLSDASKVDKVDGCRTCAYNLFCAPNPVDSQAQFGTIDVPVHQTEHCQRHMAMFDAVFMDLHHADEELQDIFHYWARPIANSGEL